ncbi:TMV resistance protein N-like isoform X2 [Punica granatum]|uniref:TMV resistance protein N-like isoform X2 n=1 Tax=Punica granatum TaxID=22663 RepID=A0A6P8D9N5_PUNGR|nr:TMV resistance protein N-like isoform X2 [Punica granatum]
MGYQVFLSFRGPDARTSIISYLYDRLRNSGIDTFKDDESLRKGRELWPEIQAAIHGSRISVPIFSNNYAWSTWCLDEVAEMVDRARSRNEAELVRLVVSNIRRELRKAHLHLPDTLIEVEDEVKEVLTLLECDSSSKDTRTVALVGMGGIGKTTLAKIVYNRLCDQFQARAFLSDVREMAERVDSLKVQSQLISQLKEEHIILNSKDEGIIFMRESFRGDKVLIFLDDISDKSQLDDLGVRSDYLGPGSRIIITTRNPDILKGPHVHYKEVTRMPIDLGVQLFSKHAFGSDHPQAPFVDLSTEIVKTTDGLPLAIEVIGSFLCEQLEEGIWKSKLDDLRKTPENKVMAKLRISYDALTMNQKHIFLDIACFFIGEDREVAYSLWKDLELNPVLQVSVLKRRCLVRIFDDDDRIYMHQQLRDMGREIVRQENMLQPERTSRLLFRTEQEEEDELARRPIFVDYTQFLTVTGADLRRYPNLQYLHMREATFSGNFRDCLMGLKYLCWRLAPPRFTVTNFNPKYLVILDLSRSKIGTGWVGWKHFKGAAHFLKVLNLSKCSRLTKTPDLSIFPKLERLILVDCLHLAEIDPSIRHLSKLLALNVEDSYNLLKLPKELSRLENLRELNLDNTVILKVPVSDGFLQWVRFLSAPCCESSTTPMTIEEGLRVDISYLRCCPLEEFRISMRELQRVRQSSPSYQRWSRRRPKDEVKADTAVMEELCQLQETGDHVPLSESPHPLAELIDLGVPCRIAILERDFLYFYCRAHPMPLRVRLFAAAMGGFIRIIRRAARLSLSLGF